MLLSVRARPKAVFFIPFRNMSGRHTAPTAFLNGPNYQKIVGFLRQHYATKLGVSAIPERIDSRIQKTVQHYMTEVSRIQGSKPVGTLNQEVLRETTASIDVWLKKQESSSPSVITTVGAFPKADDSMNRLFENTSDGYERLMAERNPPAVAPTVPDFRQIVPEQDEEDPVMLMQRMQKQRDEQARALGIASGPRLEIKEEKPSASNPVPPQADAPPPLLAPRPQDYIIPQEDVIKYRQNELNLFVTSSDRDWLRNTKENRYNFSVFFNAQDRRTGFGFNVAIQHRLRNIQQIEFVKAIVPIESLTTLVRVTDNTPTYDATRVVNVFSLPFIAVQIDELENNGFTTKPDENKTFAIVQYDTTWSSDLSAPNSYSGSAPNILAKSGYTGLIPKYLKTQKVFTPTPLATLNRLTFRLERHAGQLLSEEPDVFFLKRLCMSNNFISIGTDSTVYYNAASPQNSYIFLQTRTYFPFSAISEGDHLVIQGYSPASTSDAALEFKGFINREEGHYVVAVGYVDGSGALNDGRNIAGYCNVIVLRNRFDDPTTGSVARTISYFGGSAGAETALSATLDGELDLSGCGCLNESRQTHFVLRVITREMDSSSNIRPDNI
jgi:hypothetical protein